MQVAGVRTYIPEKKQAGDGIGWGKKSNEK
jgi:hypothetical protein